MQKFRTLCFDLDNTLCVTKGNDYKNSKPKRNAIKLVNKLYDKGYIIKIYTARYMGRSNDLIKDKNRKYFKIAKQIKKFRIKYHKLFISKPSADMYIDDKGYGFNKNWIKKLITILEK
tara:strand:- start:250 stop:603 length:354 start_codon:yes stop_codon:yes gene_type:complete